jgi:hypothetical protein
MSYFEIVMLICFGAAWPFSIYKAFKSKTANGKSFLFLLVLLIGYIFGILHKVFFSFDYVIILYIFNLIMISIDMILFVIYSKKIRS